MLSVKHDNAIKKDPRLGEKRGPKGRMSELLSGYIIPTSIVRAIIVGGGVSIREREH